MRIGIDGLNLAIPHGTGVATYAFTLARLLMSMGHSVDGLFGIDPGRRMDMRELMFFDRFGRGHGLRHSQMVRKIVLSTAFNWLPRRPLLVPTTDRVDKRAFAWRLPNFDAVWTSPLLFEIAYARFRYLGQFLTVSMPNPPDVMHWTYPVPIRMAGTRNVYTLHDLVPLELPHATLDDKRYYYRLAKKCIQVSDQICTVSEASRQQIESHFPGSISKVVNTFQSSPVPAEVASSTPAQDAAIIKGTFGLEDKGYFLFFGAADPKKNLGRIINAYLTSNVQTPLVIVSSRDWGMNEETRMLGKGGRVYGRPMRKRVIRLEYLPRVTLFRLIRTARAVLFPSLSEGFGLPALESMQLGTPVITSNTASLPEVVGDAGIQVDPYRVAEIADAIRKMDADAGLRERLSNEGLAQSTKFGDTNYSENLQNLYQTVLG